MGHEMFQKSRRLVLVFFKRTYFNLSGRRGNVPPSCYVRPVESAPTLTLDQIPDHIRIPDYARQVWESTSLWCLYFGQLEELISEKFLPNDVICLQERLVANEDRNQKIPILGSEDVKKARKASQLARKMINFASTLIEPGTCGIEKCFELFYWSRVFAHSK
jgi:hypothetical protein